MNNETSTVLGGTLGFTRAPGETIGSYAITPGGLLSTNYTITFHAGTLTITAPIPLMLPLALSGTDLVISWHAVSNANYRVQYATVLNPANWTDLPGDVSASDNTASKTDLRPATDRFYRIQVLP